MAQRALLIGINRFRDRDVNPLRGCVNDARNFGALLTGTFGFAGSNLRTLLDAEGTKAGIVDGLRWLVTGARPGDQLVLVCSSHGSHIPDESEDEPDGEDEVLVVHDHDWSRVILTDDEIARHIAQLPRGAELYTFWDTCHSGTLNDHATRSRSLMARGRNLRGPEGAEVVSKYSPPPWIAREVSGRAEQEMKRAARNAAGNAGQPDTSHVATVSFAACKDDETAADAHFRSGYAGAFLHNLQAAMQAQPRGTWEEVFQAAKRKVREGEFDQTPEIYGPSALRRAPMFGGGARAVPGAALEVPVNSPEIRQMDAQIGQLEGAGQWAQAAQVLHRRAARVNDTAEKVRTLEHLVSLYRVQLRDEAGAVRACEELLDVQPGHEGARQYLTWAYQATNRPDKLAALQARGSKSVDNEEGGIFSRVKGAVGGAVTTAVAGATAVATGVASTIEASNARPAWMDEVDGRAPQSAPQSAPQAAAAPARPKVSRCPYCSTDVAPGARSCAVCGGSW